MAITECKHNEVVYKITKQIMDDLNSGEIPMSIWGYYHDKLFNFVVSLPQEEQLDVCRLYYKLGLDNWIILSDVFYNMESSVKLCEYLADRVLVRVNSKGCKCLEYTMKWYINDLIKKLNIPIEQVDWKVLIDASCKFPVEVTYEMSHMNEQGEGNEIVNVPVWKMQVGLLAISEKYNFSDVYE